MSGRHVQTVLSDDDFKALKILALERGIPLYELLKEIVSNYLEPFRRRKEESHGGSSSG